MRLTSRRLAMVGVALLWVPLLAACGDESDITTPTPDGIAGSPNDPCRLLSQGEAATLLGRSDLQAGQPAAEDECSFTTPDHQTTLVYGVDDKRGFDLANNDLKRLKVKIVNIPGLGDQAFYYTPQAGPSDPGSTAITFLKVRKKTTYLTILVRNGESYDLDRERRVAEKLIKGA